MVEATNGDKRTGVRNQVGACKVAPGLSSVPDRSTGRRWLTIVLTVSLVVGACSSVTSTGSVACSANGELVEIPYGAGQRNESAAAANESCLRLSTETSPVQTAVAPPDPVVENDVATMVSRVSSGVLQVVPAACGSQGSGTAFLISSTQAVTAAHVVEGADSIRYESDAGAGSAEVVGFNRRADLALLRLSPPVDAHSFTLSETVPEVGVEVTAIGFPGLLDGTPLTVTTGVVSATGQRPNNSVVDLIQTDTALNPGNSGGPMLTADGQVVGIVQFRDPNAPNTSFGAQASDAMQYIDAWLASPKAVVPTPCSVSTPTTDTQRVLGLVEIRTDHPWADLMAESLDDYMGAINAGDSERAWNRLSSRAHQRNAFDKFKRETSTSFNVGVRLWGVESTGLTSANAVVTFISMQDPRYGPNGESCTLWTLLYSLVFLEGSGWLIDKAANRLDSPAPC